MAEPKKYLDAQGLIYLWSKVKLEDEKVKNLKVNGKILSSNPILSGADLLATGYVKGANAEIAATDTINQALGKLEGQIANNSTVSAKGLADLDARVTSNDDDIAALQADVAAVKVTATGDTYVTANAGDGRTITVGANTALTSAVEKANSAIQSATGDAYVTASGDANNIAVAATDKLKKMDTDLTTLRDTTVPGLATRIGANETAISNIKSAISGGTHFIGVKPELPVAPKDASAKKGDIVIVGNKEYVYNGTDGSYVKESWVELGDTTAEAEAITALQGLVGETAVGTQIDNKISALNLGGTYAVKATEGRVDDLEAKVDVAKVSTAISTAKSEAISDAKTAGDKNYAVKATEGRVDTLEGYFAKGKANDANKLEGKSKAQVIEEARTGYETAAVAGTKYVAKTTTVNGHALSNNVTIDATEVNLNGYQKKSNNEAIVANDTIQTAIAKLEAKADTANSTGVKKLTGNKYVSVDKNAGDVTITTNTTDASCLEASTDVLATAKAVKASIDALDHTLVDKTNSDLIDYKISKIVTEVTQLNGKVTVTSTEFTAMSNEDINKLLNIQTQTV